MPSLSRHHFSFSYRCNAPPSSSLLTSSPSGEYWQLSDDEPTATTTTQTIYARRKRRRGSMAKRSLANIINLLNKSKNSSGFPEVERLSFFPPYQSHMQRKSWAQVTRSYIGRLAAKLQPSASSSTPVIDTKIAFNFQYTLMASSRSIIPVPTTNWRLLQSKVLSRFKR